MEALKESLRLLLVDDDDVDRERVRRMLRSLQTKCTITEASSIFEAKECFKNKTFDCIFLDYHIGNSIGTEILNAKGYNRLNLPIILITGQGNERIAVQAIQDGIYDYIPKAQLRSDLLEATLLNTLRRVKLERELLVQRERLEYLSFFDSLTGLPNRALFFDRLKQTLQLAKRNEKLFAVMQIDLDLFKAVNDNYGHAVGDSVLMAAAQRIRQVLRAVDTVARLGGDEFAVVLPDIHSSKDSKIVAEKIVASVREPILVGKHLIQIGASIGIALYPEQGNTIDSLLTKADKAMYVAKRGKQSSLVYSEEVDDLARSPLPDANRLHQAIENNELFVEFQPIINLLSQKISGVETLVRWNSPMDGVIYPGAFIPLAESSEVIFPLSYAVIDLALDQAKLWHDSGIFLPISINLSARMLEDHDLPERILAALNMRTLPAPLLTLELTETTVMSNIEHARKVINSLSVAGIKISIDDFGVGFTSLKFLQELDISEIKIDKTFITNMQEEPRSKIIVQSISMIAKGLKVPVVAEGIEDVGMLSMLHKLGCKSGQGYGIAYPMRSDKFNAWFQSWKAKNVVSISHRIKVRKQQNF